MQGLEIFVQSGAWAIVQLAANAPVPAWAHDHEFVSITRTSDETSIICPAGAVPADVEAERGWVLLKLRGLFPFSQVGIFASVAGPLAEAGIPLLALGTFNTDYFLVKQEQLPLALAALTTAGHHVSVA